MDYSEIISITVVAWIFLSIGIIAASVQGNIWMRRARKGVAEVLREYRVLGQHIGYIVAIKAADVDHEVSITVEDENYRKSIQIGQTYNVVYARTASGRRTMLRYGDIKAYFEKEADTVPKTMKKIRRIMLSLMVAAPIVISIIYMILL